MTLGAALQSGLSGLRTSQRAIDVTANNVVNSRTPGYSRKIHNQNSVVLGGVGVGVNASFSSRVVDEGLLSQLNKESGIFGSLAVKGEYMGRIETLFGSPESDTSLSHTMSNVQDAFEQLAIDAKSAVAQGEAVSSIKSLVDRVNNMTDYIQNSRAEADKSIESLVKEVNQLLVTIDKLNLEIMETEALGQYSPDDFLDQRDRAFQRLSEIMDVQSFTRSTGEIVILTSSGQTLLDNDPTKVTHNGATALSAYSSYSGGEISGIYINGHDITHELKSGEISGYVELRDEILPELQSELDEMMQVLAKELNLIQSRGTSYPAMQSEYTSTKTFLNLDGSISATNMPSVKISGGDVKMIILDKDGKEISSTGLLSELDFSEGKIYDPVGYPQNDSLAATIQNWLTVDPTGPKLVGAEVGVNEDGSLFITTGSSEYSLAFRDESSAIVGSDPQDVSIEFDLDGDGVYDTEDKGFVNSFGLNDLIVNPAKDWLYASDVMSRNEVIGVTSPTLPKLVFSDEKNIGFGEIEILPGETIADLAERINKDPILSKTITADIVLEAGGARLRIMHNTAGTDLVITEPTSAPPVGSGVLKQLGLAPSASTSAGMYEISEDVLRSSDNLSRGQVQYDSSTGEYFASVSDNTIANQFSSLFGSDVSFDQAGSFSSGSYSFTSYAANIVSQVASLSSANESEMTYQGNLVLSLDYKAAEISGVDLDSELAHMTVLQQSYNASSKIISIVNEMLTTLINMV